MTATFRQTEKDALAQHVVPPAMQDCPAHARIDALEERLDQHADDLHRIDQMLEKNTELTAQIEHNTAEIVTLFKGARAVRSLVIWWAPIAAAIAATVAWIKGAK